tara:strand:+ start:3171 stop:4559 length:1389 start_codon:yes stop_codon:yes gene_type:complete
MKSIIFATAILVAIAAAQTSGAVQTLTFSSVESAGFSGTGFYCCSPETMTAEPSEITAKTCNVQGGYCMGNQKSGAWIFEIPQLPPDTIFTSIRLTGHHPVSATGWGSLGFRWIGDDALSTDSAYTTMYYPDAATSAFWSGTTFNYTAPLSMFALPSGGRLMVVARNDSSSLITISNADDLAPVLTLTFDAPQISCEGDMNYDRSVDVVDLLAIISGWDNPYNVADLLNVIEHWDSPCDLPGACCLSDGTCMATDAYDCEAAGGIWNGSDTFCSYVGCPQPGACCMDDDSCAQLLPDVCEAEGGHHGGTGSHCIITDCSIPPLNDECVDAHVVSNGSFDFSITEATDSSDPYSYDCEIPGPFGWMEQDLWWAYEATCTGTLTADLCGAVGFNADIVVYEGTCQDMMQIACNGHYPGDGGEQCYLGARVDTQVTAGTSYLIRVGFDGVQYPHEDYGTLSISCE